MATLTDPGSIVQAGQYASQVSPSPMKLYPYTVQVAYTSSAPSVPSTPVTRESWTTGA